MDGLQADKHQRQRQQPQLQPEVEGPAGRKEGGVGTLTRRDTAPEGVRVCSITVVEKKFQTKKVSYFADEVSVQRVVVLPFFVSGI